MRKVFGIWGTLPRALPYVRPYRRLGLLAILFPFLGAAVALAEPWPLAILVDSALGDRPAPGFVRAVFGGEPGIYAFIAFAVGLGFAITFFTHATTVLSDWVGAKLEQRMVLDLRTDLFEHAQRLSLTFHDGRLTGQLMNQINNQAAALGVIVMAFPPILQAVLTLIGMFTVTVLISWEIAVVSLVAVPMVWWSLGLYGTRIVPRLQRVQAMEWKSLSIVHEAMSMLRVIVSFGRERHELKRFRDQGTEAVEERIRLTLRQTLFSLAVTSATALGTGLVLGVGAWLVVQGRITIGELLVLIAYVAAIYQPLEQISTTIGNLNDQFVQFNSSLELLGTEPEVKEAPDAITMPRGAGLVVFEGVSFSYAKRQDTIRDVSFVAPPGARVAVVGPTGAGKTTLASLLIRFYDPAAGRILIDNVDIRKLKLASLREQISVVLQEPVLFSGSIADNIAYGKLGASREEIEASARAANAHDFIARLPDGYDTEIGERGAQLSGGERQRIAVARAFIKDAPILILDEPTSSIDSRTEAVILDALEELMEGRTSFMIAHRLSTVRESDLILVMRDGRLVEQGTHEELVQREGAYYELYEAQNRPRVRRRERVLAAGPGATLTADRAGAGLVDHGLPGRGLPGEPGNGGVPAEPLLPGEPGRGADGAGAFALHLRDDATTPLPAFTGGPAPVERVAIPGRPTGIAFARGAAYVSRAGASTLSRVDLHGFRAPTASHRVPPGASDIAAGFGALWVTSTRPAALTRIDLDTGERRAVKLPGGGLPIAVVAGADEVWVGLRGEGDDGRSRLVRVPPTGVGVLQTLPLAGELRGLDTGAGALWVVHGDAPAVTRIDARSGWGAPRRVSGTPYALAAAEGRAWVALRDGAVERVAGDGPRRKAQTGGALQDAVGVGRRIWLADRRGRRLVPVDAVSGRPAGAPVVLADIPDKVARLGRDVYVVSGPGGAIERVRRAGEAPW